MKISDILKSKKRTLSFEVFPPKTTDKYASVIRATGQIAALQPDFMSVTYGAGGGTSDFTADVARNIKYIFEVEVLAHLTCVSSTKEHVKKMIEKYKENDIENILALRGDIPSDGNICSDYRYASDLISEIRSDHSNDFCIGGGCYPECHPEAENLDSDIEHMKIKVDSGCDFLTTQLFMDNEVFLRYFEKAVNAGINVPIIAGIMPITNPKTLRRSIEMSGTFVPERFLKIMDKFGDNSKAMAQAGIIYATEQCIELFSYGINNIHIYTMNKPEVASAIKNNLKDFLDN
ncbi:MAG: methylenetetrahydrofolate reductase [NAD(P)H] [Lachnospiraceae bacterium]|jgi:methylenetetrahydrofolate reductase (NADPH)